MPPVQFIPHPTTWLNREGWLDDPYAPREKSKEDLAAEAQAKAARERELSARFLEAEREREAKAAPPPKCAHGLTIAMCRLCVGKVADGDN